uniref:Secreted protein n=1 Tax=Cannabis sativa TaxID=3483 RepID=A0A803R4C5_CANSA
MLSWLSNLFLLVWKTFGIQTLLEKVLLSYRRSWSRNQLPCRCSHLLLLWGRKPLMVFLCFWCGGSGSLQEVAALRGFVGMRLKTSASF